MLALGARAGREAKSKCFRLLCTASLTAPRYLPSRSRILAAPPRTRPFTSAMLAASAAAAARLCATKRTNAL